MNKKQLAYQSIKYFTKLDRHLDKIFFVESLLVINKSFEDIRLGLCVPIFAYLSYIKFNKNRENRTLKKYCKKTQEKEENPLQHYDEIIFEDISGLEKLLEKTEDKEKKEWGTFFKTKYNGEKVIIDNILDIDLARKLGLVDKERRDSISSYPNMAVSFGYSGFIHYHPIFSNKFKWLGAMNYDVSVTDRCTTDYNLNWIELITFNMPEGPEIIGYNLRHTYIPASKKDKSRLIKADSKTIREYLKD